MSKPTLPRNFPPRIGVFLVGFMGCGKTTVGQILSQRLGWSFQDLDARIEVRQCCRIAEIFSNHGESRFRQIEREALLELINEMGSTSTVAALGGGAFAEAENRRLIQATGFKTVFLDAPVEELWDRCRSREGERPLAQDKNQFRQLYEARRSLYMEAAVRIDTSGRDAESVAIEIISWLDSRPKE